MVLLFPVVIEGQGYKSLGENTEINSTECSEQFNLSSDPKMKICSIIEEEKTLAQN